MKETPEQREERHRSYWRRNVRLIVVLMSVWFAVSILFSIVFVELLNRVSLGGVPLGFWTAQQGSIFVFIILIFLYVRGMDKLDHAHRMDTDDQENGK